MPEPQDYRTIVPVAGVTGSKMSQCVCVVGQCDRTPADKKSLRDMVVAVAEVDQRLSTLLPDELARTSSELHWHGRVSGLFLSSAIAADRLQHGSDARHGRALARSP